MPKTILAVDDDPLIAKLLDQVLSREQYLVLAAHDGRVALDLARRHLPDVIILDWILPVFDGLEVCRRLRQDRATAGIPVLMLTGMLEESHEAVALRVGADDFLRKPFRPFILAARVSSLLRRAAGMVAAAELLRIDDLTIDSARHEVRLQDREVALTLSEFKILRALAERPGRVFARAELIDTYRGEDAAVSDRAVDLHLLMLRRKLGQFGAHLETVRGVGYRMVPT